jgi:hypothetical protein
LHVSAIETIAIHSWTVDQSIYDVTVSQSSHTNEKTTQPKPSTELPYITALLPPWERPLGGEPQHRKKRFHRHHHE